MRFPVMERSICEIPDITRCLWLIRAAVGRYIKLESQFERQRTTAMKATQLGAFKVLLSKSSLYLSACVMMLRKKYIFESVFLA